MAEKSNIRSITVNRKARHDYFVIDTYEAGIALVGTEVKSLRCGQVNLKDAYCEVDKGEIFLVGTHISPYEKGNIWASEPTRKRKLLMHKREILKLRMASTKEGFTLIPLSLYFSGKNVKVELGVCKGKKLYDKREAIAERENERYARRHEFD